MVDVEYDEDDEEDEMQHIIKEDWKGQNMKGI